MVLRPARNLSAFTAWPSCRQIRELAEERKISDKEDNKELPETALLARVMLWEMAVPVGEWKALLVDVEPLVPLGITALTRTCRELGIGYNSRHCMVEKAIKYFEEKIEEGRRQDEQKSLMSPSSEEATREAEQAGGLPGGAEENMDAGKDCRETRGRTTAHSGGPDDDADSRASTTTTELPKNDAEPSLTTAHEELEATDEKPATVMTDHVEPDHVVAEKPETTKAVAGHITTDEKPKAAESTTDHVDHHPIADIDAEVTETAMGHAGADRMLVGEKPGAPEPMTDRIEDEDTMTDANPAAIEPMTDHAAAAESTEVSEPAADLEHDPIIEEDPEMAVTVVDHEGDHILTDETSDAAGPMAGYVEHASAVDEDPKTTESVAGYTEHDLPTDEKLEVAELDHLGLDRMIFEDSQLIEQPAASTSSTPSSPVPGAEPDPARMEVQGMVLDDPGQCPSEQTDAGGSSQDEFMFGGDQPGPAPQACSTPPLQETEEAAEGPSPATKRRVAWAVSAILRGLASRGPPKPPAEGATD